MKNQIKQLLLRLGYQPCFCDNFDDNFQGVEFNPTSYIIVRWSWGISATDFPGTYHRIEKWVVSQYSDTVKKTTLLGGEFLLLPDGEWDEEFYYKFLKHYIL